MKFLYLPILILMLWLGLAGFCRAGEVERPDTALLHRMSAETVRLAFRPDRLMHVQVDFTFTGDFSQASKQVFPETAWFELKSFTVSWNGVALKPTRQQPPPNHGFLILKVKYPALFFYDVPSSRTMNNSLLVEYEYEPPFHAPGTKVELTDQERNDQTGQYVEYVLRTGATWDGTIGSVEVLFDPGPIPCAQIKTLPDSVQGICQPDGCWRFFATNLKPDKNIRLLLPVFEKSKPPALVWETRECRTSSSTNHSGK